jgi:integrase
MPLNVPQIKNAKPAVKPYKLADGGGLYLLINSNGSKYWRLKYRYGGREKVLALGVYPDVSLALARDERQEAKKHLRDFVDPSKVRKQRKQATISKTVNSFEAVAQEWWQKQVGRWSLDHGTKVWRSLESDVLPYLGHRPISEITTDEVLAAVRRVEKRQAFDLAGRILQRCSSVFRYAIQTKRTSNNPTADCAGALETRKRQHRLALKKSELPAFLKELKNYEGHPVTRLALTLLTITFVRSGELRFATWDEFDLNNKMWRIPAERMKMGTEHLVPLCRQAIAVLADLKQYTGDDKYLFTGERSKLNPISNNTMIYAMYRLGYKSRATPHGFRTSASSILNEEGFNRDAIERQLSHMERNQVRGAYTQYAEYLKERTTMMEWWGNYIEQLETSSNTVPINVG